MLHTALILAVLALTQIYGFSVLSFSSLESSQRFGDLRVVIQWADCFKQVGDSVYQQFNPAISCSGYVYSETLLRLLGILQISVSFTDTIGYLFLLLVAIMLGYQSKFSGKSQILSVLILFSPPIALLADRANLDALIAFLVFLSAISYSKGHKPVALILIAFSTLIKFYTLPLLVFALFLTKTVRGKVFVTTLLFLSGTLALFSLNKIETPFPGGYFAKFGFSVWTSYADKLPIQFPGIVESWAVLCLVSTTAIFVVLKMRNYVLSLDLDINNLSGIQTLTVWALLVHFSCFMFGLSYDYRLLFIIIATLGFLSDPKYLISTRERFSVATLLVLSCWLTFLTPFLAPLGDLALEILTLWLLLRTIIPLATKVGSFNERSL